MSFRNRPHDGLVGRMSVFELAPLLKDRIGELATQLLGQPNSMLSSKNELRFGSKGSLSVVLDGEKRGCWYDHEAGFGGAGVAMIRHCLAMSLSEARDWAQKWLGEISEVGEVREKRRARNTSATLLASPSEKLGEKVANILDEAVSPISTPVISYLHSRGITAAPPDSIRYQPSAFGRYGAMVALITDEAGDVLAVQRTYLTDEGKKAPLDTVKRTNKAADGWAERGAVRLRGRQPLVLCEGVETGLSVWQATGQEVWVCCGVSNIAKAPVPQGATVIIARDGDEPGTIADRQILNAAKLFTTRGTTVSIASPPEGQDFNDVLRSEGERAVLDLLLAAVPMRSEQSKCSPQKLSVGSDIEIARRIQDDLNEQYGRVVHAEGAFWRFNGTSWEAFDEHTIRLRVHDYDGVEFLTASSGKSRVKLSKSRIDSVLHECATLCADPTFFVDVPAGINCASGFIRFDGNGEPHLEPHHRDHRCRHTLSASWFPGASGSPPEGSLLHRLLDGCFRGDPDAQAKCDLLAEVCGSAALGYATRLRQPRAVVLHGKSAENGKSQIIELARNLLPKSAVCSVPAAKMADERHIIALAGKLLNASDELSPEAIASDTFESVVTGEPIHGRDLYKSRFEFRSTAQNLFATNHLPSFKGGVDRGVQRRLVVVPFGRTIPLDERIEDIGKRIALEEADLLLAWAIEGASRLIRQRNFAIPDTCRQALNEWVLGEDPVLAWIDACVIVVAILDGRPKISTRDAYNRFNSWALIEGFKPEKIPAINGFVQRLQAQVAGIQHKRSSEGRFFIGIIVTQQ